MIRLRYAEILILAAIASFGMAPAARGQSYGTELPFVLGTGARSSGMGAAAVTLADDASVQHYNPAGLGYLQWKEVVFYRTSLFDSKSVYHALSYAHPLLSQGTLAFSLMRVDAGGVEERDVNNQLLSTDLHSAQTRILLGYARNITPSLAAGLNIKLDNESFGGYSGFGVGLDIGLMATRQLSGGSFLRGFRGGLAIQNVIEPSLKLDRDKVADPMSIGLGVSALSGFGNVMLVTSLDIVNPRYSPFDIRFGQEVVYGDYFALRFGLDDVTPTYGFGARFKQLALDYAFRSEDLGNNHRFSLAVKFGASVPQQMARAREQLEHEVNTKLVSRMAEMERVHVAGARREADSLYTAGAYEEAAARYEMVLLWDPKDDRAGARLTQSRYRHALSLAEKAAADGSYIEGVFYSNRALSFVPGDSTAAAFAEQCGEQVKATENSQAMLAQLLKTSIDLYAERRFTEALSGFDEALRIDPNTRFALEYAEKCRVSIDEQVRRHRADAAARAKRGDYEGAASALQSALEYTPDDPAIRKELEGYKRQRDEANIALLNASTGTAPPAAQGGAPSGDVDKALDQHYRSGMASFNAGDFKVAIASFVKVWTVQPDYYSVSDLLTKAYLFVGMGLYSDHKYAEAIEAWEKALTVDPTNSKAKRYLSKAHEELQRLSGAYNAK